ncbi:MAG: T9SS type A sorting domain-containing protein [Sphingobacteriales bacterium]|nr:MAG: T9SS type A sorting domain-containing protein [Sphingobacteriales bacterium]
MIKKLSLAALLASAALSANATYYQITLSGFNQDIVANGVGNASGSTSKAVDAADWDFVSADFKVNAGDAAPGGALPANGLINSAATAGVQYQLANYTGNNALQLDASTTTGSLNFSANHTGDLYVLGSTGSGTADVTITVKFSDGTTQAFTGVNFPDWYGGTGYAIQQIGRVNRTNNTLENPAGDPRLYERKLTLLQSNYSKTITGVDVAKTGGSGVLNIMAITICQVPVVGVQPSPSTICETQNTFFVTSATEASSVRWQVDDGSGFADVVGNSVNSGVSTGTLTLTNVPASYNNNLYRCKMVSTCGATVYTVAQRLSVTPAVFITAQPAKDTSCVRGSASISITNSGTAVNVKWQMASTANGFADVPNVYPFSGVNSTRLDIAYTEDTLDGKIFRCIVDGTCNTATTTPIQFTVLPSPEFTSQPADVKVKALGKAVFTASATGHNFNIYWQASNDGVIFSNINDNGIYTGTKTNTLTIASVLPASDGLTFRCILKSNETSCNTVRDTSDAVKLTIDIPTSVNDVELNNDITIYPNPAADVLHFSTATTYMQVAIYDLNGRLVLSQKLKGNNISISNLPAGVYAAVFMGEGDKKERHQFIKQ